MVNTCENYSFTFVKDAIIALGCRGHRLLPGLRMKGDSGLLVKVLAWI